MPPVYVVIMARNEAANITKALKSVKFFATGVLLVDTGSTDNTVGIFRHMAETLRLNHAVDHHEWRNFAHNRSLALESARRFSKGQGFTLMLDADDRVSGSSIIRPDWEADAYCVEYRLNNVRYHRVSIFRNNVMWQYLGILHEYPFCAVPHQIGAILLTVEAGTSGNRSNDPLKYLHDADKLQKALNGETDRTLRNRYCFYLAQSYRDAGHAGAAIYWYKIVVNNDSSAGNWSEERYIAALMLGRLLNNKDWFRVAYTINPLRAEALWELGEFEQAAQCKTQPDWLFVETDKYGAKT